jgi:hypothetical protein
LDFYISYGGFENQLYLRFKVLIIQFLNRHKRKLQTNTENIHTPIPLQTLTNNDAHIYPSLTGVIRTQASTLDEDNVSLKTKDLIISYVKQIPSHN